jgi:hypothetical protein
MSDVDEAGAQVQGKRSKMPTAVANKPASGGCGEAKRTLPITIVTIIITIVSWKQGGHLGFCDGA